MKHEEIADMTFNNLTYVWTLGLFVTQVVVQAIAARKGPFKANPSLLAHQVCSLAAMSFIAGCGVYYWFTEAGHAKDRIYSKLEGGVVVSKANLAFQIYDLIATICIRDLRKAEMLVHHSLAILLAYFLLRNDYCHYYSIFFLGVTEASSIPLCIVDVFKHFRKLAARYDALNTSLRILFALGFMVIRVVWWPCISYRYFSDTYQSYKDGTIYNPSLVAFFAISNILLTLLQWKWGIQIVQAAMKMASGETTSKKTELRKAV